jgi:proteasome lid subunit RPN8/RPN11
VYSVYVRQKAVEKAESYFAELAVRKLEGMGFLIGSPCTHEGRKFVVISDFVTSETDSSPVSVKFSTSAFEKLSVQLNKIGENIVVGWCHSHPSYGCFLSSTDVSTQRRFFNEDFHIAGVFDPLKKEAFGDKVNAMAKRFYRLTGNGYGEVSFAVIK